MIDYRYLDAFVAVCEELNFTKAGIRLGIATSAISRQIRMLEDSCKIQLFLRSPRQVSMTAEGLSLFESAKGFSASVDELLGRPPTTKLRIGTLDGVLQHWLSKVIASESFPKTADLEIFVGMPDVLLGKLEKNELDVCFFSFVHASQPLQNLSVYRLFREEIVLISSHRVGLAQVLDYPWVCLSSGTWLMKYTSKRPKKIITVNSMRGVVDLVRKGLGIAMVPLYVVKEYSDLYRTPVERYSDAHICMATHDYRFAPKIIAELMDVIKPNSAAWKRIH
jgi:DNA-binding transcriptional LysR family regulator